MKKILICLFVFMTFNSLISTESPIQNDFEVKFERLNEVLEILKSDVEHREYYQAILHVEANIVFKSLNNLIKKTEDFMIVFKNKNDEQRFQEMKKAHESYIYSLKLLEVTIAKALTKK